MTQFRHVKYTGVSNDHKLFNVVSLKVKLKAADVTVHWLLTQEHNAVIHICALYR